MKHRPLPPLPGATLTLGVTIEVQLLDRSRLTLADDSRALADALAASRYRNRVQPAAAGAKLEIISAGHATVEALQADIDAIRIDLPPLAAAAGRLIAGGGCHPLPASRDEPLFGLHLRVGCPDPVLADYLCAAWPRYLAQLIALSAASPFHAGGDTACDSYRAAHLEAASRHRTDEAIRRLPNGLGIEIRVCDAPLNLDTAVDLAAYAQAVSGYLLAEVPEPPDDAATADHHQARLQAARFGFDGLLGAHDDGKTIGQDILEMIELMRQAAHRPEIVRVFERIEARVMASGNDAATMRNYFRRDREMAAVMARVALAWSSARQDKAFGQNESG